MLVNVSRFNDVQARVKEKLVEYLTEAQNAIKYSYKMTSALENPVILMLKNQAESIEVNNHKIISLTNLQIVIEYTIKNINCQRPSSVLYSG